MSRQFTLIVVCVAMPVAIVVTSRIAASQSTQEDRLGMSEEEYRQFANEAKRFGMTPAAFRRWVDDTVGTPVLWEDKRKVVVAYQRAPDGTPKTIQVLSHPEGDELVAFRYDLGGGKGESSVEYGTMPGPGRDGRRDVAWHDLNADGTFDRLFVLTEHHELLELDRGMYILLHGKWVAARREETMPKDEVKAGETTYAFDARQGRWTARDPR